MYSIPIARSTLRLASGHVGKCDWGQDFDPVGKSWGPASYLGVSLRCPSIHTSSRTRQFPRISCVKPKLVIADGGFFCPQCAHFGQPRAAAAGYQFTPGCQPTFRCRDAITEV